MQTNRKKYLGLGRECVMQWSTRIGLASIAGVALRSMTLLIIGVATNAMLVSTSQAQVNSIWGGTSGDWSDAARWSSSPLFPNNGNGGNDYNVSINTGTVNVDLPISIHELAFGGSTIARTNNLIVNANFTWNFGTVTGAGALQIDGGGILNTNALVYDGPIRFGDGVNASTIAHTNLGRLVLNNAAQASVRNGTTYEINVTSSGSNFGSATSATPGTFTVEAGGILRKTGSATHLIANNVALNNYGTIEVGQGGLEFTIGGIFNNSGAIEVNAGILDFAFGGTFATNVGSVSLAPGAKLRGNITNGATGRLQGAGTVMGAVTLEAGGRIEAGVGETATTLTLTNGLTMADDSNYAVTLFGTGPSAISMLAVTGDAEIATAASLRLDLSALSAVDVAALRADIGEGNSRSYTVLTTTGTIFGGGFDEANFMISDYGSFLASEWKFEPLTNANTVEIALTPVVGLPGDYNGDGVVDAADYVVWRDNLGTSFALPNRDPSSTGDVSQVDYDIWKLRFGATLSTAQTSTSAVPEPRTMLLAALAMLSELSAKRRTPTASRPALLDGRL